MIHFHLAASDLSQLRFAASPLWETVASVRTLSNAQSAGNLRQGWISRIRRRATTTDATALLMHLVPPTGYIPDFLMPSPARRTESFQEALENLSNVDPELVATQLAHLAKHAALHTIGSRAKRQQVLQGMVDRPDAGLTDVVDALYRYHQIVIKPDWTRIEALLHDDITYRLQAIAEGGVSHMMQDLHPLMTFTNGTLRIVKRCEALADLDGRGLVLVPSAFAWPDVMIQTAHPNTPTISYAPRGVGRLWERQRTVGDATLTGLLGRTKATLLTQLDLPMSTSQAAIRLALSAPTLNVHLKALQAAGLLTSHRDGRRVLYSRTDLGDRLLAEVDRRQNSA